MKITPEENYVLVKIEHPQMIIGKTAHAETRHKIVTAPEWLKNREGHYILFNPTDPNYSNVRIDQNTLMVNTCNIVAYVDYDSE